MPYISFEMTSPVETFVLTKDLKFSKIKVMDITVDTNGFDPALTNVLFQLNDHSENMFVFKEGSKNALNTDYLVDLPLISGASFNFSSAELRPFHYIGDTQSIRYLRMRALDQQGNILTNAEFGTTSLHFIIWFE